MGYITEKEMLRCRPLLARPVSPRLPPHQLKVQPLTHQAQPLLHLQQRRHLSQKPERSSEFPAKYDRSIEAGWYDWWRDQGYFRPNSDTCKNSGNIGGIGKKRFAMVLPPPNVTGVLHLGHALTATVQDSLVRYHRMRGCETVWVPGCDHAGIATQVVVEKKLLAGKGVSRHQLGRPKFIEEVENWQKEKGGVILDQLCELGASLDWTRNQFTLSKEFRLAVDAAFIRLFERGLVYRSDHQLVNWCPSLCSAISDIEVEHVPVEGKVQFEVPGCPTEATFGVMTYIAYKVVGKKEEVVVGTTRPETMLGDTGVAVHPDDPRYKHLNGAQLWHPFRSEPIPLILDPSVSMELGTGAVKITPAHDKNDWEMGQRHKLPSLQVIDKEGKISGTCDASFAGKHRFEVRAELVKKLDSMGLLRGEEEHAMSVPVCSRTGDVIEPLVAPQWFLSSKAVCELASKAVKEGDLKLEPSHHNAVWQQFMGEARDWCLSRQIWWGHQIPAYSCQVGGKECWVAAASEEEARVKAARKFDVSKEEEDQIVMTRDEDVLDTWFSSAIYPFAVLGWPEEKSEDLARFYPLDLMETGHDILFFWVGRMVMLGIALTGKLPFSEVLLHGVITDPEGRKMSKSLGNVVDPMHLIHGAGLDELEGGLEKGVAEGLLEEEERQLALESLKQQWPSGIPAHGTDPLRWALASYDVKSQQIALEPRIVQGAATWCNKVWQLARLLNLAHDRAGGKELTPGLDFSPGLMDMWVLNQLATTVDNVNKHWEARELHLVTRELRKFIYTDVCDTYVEFVKPSLADPESPDFLPSLLILHSCVLTSIKLLHPIIPFLSEELFQRLPILPKERRRESVMVEAYPQPIQWNGFLNPNLESTMEEGLEMVRSVRSMKSRYELDRTSQPTLLVATKRSGLRELSEVVRRLGGVGEVLWTDEDVDGSTLPQGFIHQALPEVDLFMDVGQHINYDKELKKLEEKLKKVGRDQEKVEKQMRGKFQFRLSSEEAATRREELEKVAALLKDQKNMVERLKMEAEMLKSSD